MSVWFPECETWYHVFTEKKIEGKGDFIDVPITLNNFGLFARAGSIIPIHRVSE